MKLRGVERQYSLGADTVGDEACFFSHRRSVKQGESTHGTLLSVIVLRE
jgi:copper oxidase (laccase) domain-containing protein